MSSSIPDQAKYVGLKCSLCQVDAATTALCTANDKGGLVSFGSKGSHVECYIQSECHARKNGSVVKSFGNSGQNQFEYFQKFVEKCRHGASEVFSLEGISFYGGSQSKVENVKFDQNEWLVISLLGFKSQYNLPSGIWTERVDPLISWQTELSQYTPAVNHPQMTIEWPDMGIPACKPGFWIKLYSLIKKAGFKHVLFYCIGGHGRTGTALSSLLIECSEIAAEEAVTFVRAAYCKEAVESKSQVTYLELLEKRMLERKEGAV